MPTFANQTIVVSWDNRKYGPYSCFAALAVQPEMPVVIKWAGFNPKESVMITICVGGKDIPLGKATANSCGAFDLSVNLPAGILPSGTPVPTTVKASVLEVLKAVWPVNVMKQIPKMP